MWVQRKPSGLSRMGRNGKKVTVWPGERTEETTTIFLRIQGQTGLCVGWTQSAGENKGIKQWGLNKAMLSHVVDTVWFFRLHPFTCDAILDSPCLVTPHAMREHVDWESTDVKSWLGKEGKAVSGKQQKSRSGKEGRRWNAVENAQNLCSKGIIIVPQGSGQCTSTGTDLRQGKGVQEGDRPLWMHRKLGWNSANAYMQRILKNLLGSHT